MNKLPAIAIATLPVMMVIAVVELITSIFSTALAKEICGERYMQQLGRVVREPPCGLNAGVYFMAVLALVITAAMVVLLLSLGHDQPAAG